jgi:hypothetical protein
MNYALKKIVDSTGAVGDPLKLGFHRQKATVGCWVVGRQGALFTS